MVNISMLIISTIWLTFNLSVSSVSRPCMYMLGLSSLTHVLCMCKIVLHPLYVNIESITPDHHEVLWNDELWQWCWCLLHNLLLVEVVGPPSAEDCRTVANFPQENTLPWWYVFVTVGRVFCHACTSMTNLWQNQDSHTCAVVEVFHDITKIIITEVSTSMTINRTS